MLGHICQCHGIQICLNIVQHQKMVRRLVYIVRQRRFQSRKIMPGNQADQCGHHSDHNLIRAGIMKEMLLVKLHHMFPDIYRLRCIGMKNQIINMLRIVKSFGKKLTDDIMLLHKRRKHLVKCRLPKKNVKNSRLVVKHLYIVKTPRRDKDKIPLKKIQTFQPDILNTYPR